MTERLFVKVTRETLPQVKDKYPFLYLERGRFEIDDSSLKWINSDGDVVRIPVATLNALLLGPGTAVTHEAVKVAAAANCAICWVGEDSMHFYAAGYVPTATTKNLQRQVQLSAHKTKSLNVAKNMFLRRFPDVDLAGKTLKALMGMEGQRVKALYEEKALEYGVGWQGRRFVPGQFKMSDVTNKMLTSMNAALYGILCSSIHALGYSPYIGFVHSGSPMPFVYDLADLYKADLTIDLAFSLTKKMAGQYDKYQVANAFRKRVLELNLLDNIVKDIRSLFEDA